MSWVTLYLDWHVICDEQRPVFSTEEIGRKGMTKANTCGLLTRTPKPNELYVLSVVRA
jgi:hypothetical protein